MDNHAPSSAPPLAKIFTQKYEGILHTNTPNINITRRSAKNARHIISTKTSLEEDMLSPEFSNTSESSEKKIWPSSGLTPYCLSIVEVKNETSLPFSASSTSSQQNRMVLAEPLNPSPSKTTSAQYPDTVTCAQLQKVKILKNQPNAERIHHQHLSSSKINDILDNSYDLEAVRTYLICANCRQRVYTEVIYRAGIMTIVKSSLIAIFG